MPEEETSRPEGGSSGLTRRRFLAASGRGLMGVSLLSSIGLAGCLQAIRPRAVERTPPGSAGRSLTASEWQALAAVQDHILPSAPGSPGARDVNATGYLDAALTGSDIDPAETTQIKEGASRLEQLARDMGAASFADLSENRREEALRALEEDDPGESWLRLVIIYTMEALLGDPAYGGNTDEAGWRWLEHTPGFPRPTAIAEGARR